MGKKRRRLMRRAKFGKKFSAWLSRIGVLGQPSTPAPEPKKAKIEKKAESVKDVEGE